MRHTTKTTLTALLAGTALLLGACSSSTDDTAPKESTSTTQVDKAKSEKPKETKSEKPEPTPGNLSKFTPDSEDEFSSDDNSYISTIGIYAESDEMPSPKLENFRDEAIEERLVMAVLFGHEVMDALVAIPEDERTSKSMEKAIDEVADRSGYGKWTDPDNQTAVMVAAAITAYDDDDYWDTVKD